MGNGVDTEDNVDVEIWAFRRSETGMMGHRAPMLFMTPRRNVNVDPVIS